MLFIELVIYLLSDHNYSLIFPEKKRFFHNFKRNIFDNGNGRFDLPVEFSRVFVFSVTTTTTAKPTAAVSSFTSSSSSPSRSSVCSLSKHYGTCLTESIRFYHDPHSNSCRKFRYTGCGGNGNNFLSGEECVRTCGGVLDVSASASAPLTPTVILIFMKIIKKYCFVHPVFLSFGFCYFGLVA